MKSIWTQNPHTPTHLLLDDADYMITGAIYQRKPFLKADADKALLLEILQECYQLFEWELNEWVILDNHYHLMVKSKRGCDLPELMGRIHRKSARLIKRRNSFVCKRFWWNYWDRCIRDEKDYYTRLNYLYYNPIKHGYVTDLREYRWSSFHETLETRGREALVRQYQKYPFDELEIPDDF